MFFFKLEFPLIFNRVRNLKEHDNGWQWRATTAHSILKTISFNRSNIIMILNLIIERKERERAVDSLRTFLAQKRQFTELDFLKLWKGLYYCMWMCDRMRVQQQLADTLGDLVSVLQDNNTILFIQAFWTILAKQWPTLDQHRWACHWKLTDSRLDKFYLLARRYVAAGLKFLQSKDWSQETVTEYNEMLESGPLRYDSISFALTVSPKNTKIPNSIRYHITDIYLDELDKIQPLEEAGEDFKSSLSQLLTPFKKLQKEGLDKVARTKAKELLEDLRLDLNE